jgi:16S rRNA (uracil1498-N3)-methyltransferase
MRLYRCYCDQTLKEGLTIRCTGDAAHHLITVLRVKKGDQLSLFNGDLHEYSGTITALRRLELDISIFNQILKDTRLPRAIHLGQAIIKNNPMDLAIQKATELGVQAITPLWTAHTAITLTPDRVANKMAHWKHILIQAAEQCGRTEIPFLYPPMPLSQWLLERTEPIRLWLDPRASQHMSNIEPPTRTPLALCIGPEGGFSTTETQKAMDYHFTVVHIGSLILRAETATLATLAIIHNMSMPS